MSPSPVHRPVKENLEKAVHTLRASTDKFEAQVGAWLEDVLVEWPDVGMVEKSHADRIARAWLTRSKP